ncbi:MAG TPA: adenylate/guanylate cyclase domain-containing protein [Longimicrobiales bacterium]
MPVFRADLRRDVVEAHGAVVFADIEKSVQIMRTLGDTEGRRFIAGMIGALEVVTAECRGQVIKTLGDEILSFFPSVQDGLDAAAAMQRAVRAHPPAGKIVARLRVGVHSGPVLLEGGDIFGDVVNLAARVVAMAKGDHILTTVDTLDRVDRLALAIRSLGQHPLRGTEQPMEIWAVLWEEDVEEVTRAALRGGRQATGEIVLMFEDQKLARSADSVGEATLGRKEDNAVVVADELASRYHATVRARAARFYLADHSANGTYVRPEGQEEIFVHRDEVLLQGHGSLRLGRSFHAGDGPTVKYWVATPHAPDDASR